MHVAGVRPDWQQVAVADAGADNSTVLFALIPKAYRQIDFWHACQHLGAAAEHILPLDSAARARGGPGVSGTCCGTTRTGPGR